MNCKICGSSEFCTNDGITYCTECQSQIEETQAEEAVEHTCRESGSSAAKKKSTAEKKKEYSDWITAECFNHILYMQVSALIKLGASQNLKKTVLHIWSKYLQKCEVAFRTDLGIEDGKPHLGPVPSKRDLKVLYGDKVVSRRKRKIPKVLVDNVSSEEITNVSDTDHSTNVDSVISEKKCEKKRYSYLARKLLRKSSLKTSNRCSYQKKVFNMTLQKTLSICYLGLIYTEDKLSLLDLIRFTYEGKIPYVNIIDKLPSSLKLQDSDTNIFLVYTVPDAYSILKLSHEIADFLKLPKLKDPSVFLAISRFVKEFNLPDDIKSVVKILMERYKEQLSNCQSKHVFKNDVPHDYEALAFIIISLKILFVLDDKFEIEHSKVMNKLNMICEDRKYFVWKEWKEHSVIKEYLFLCEEPGYCSINKLDGLNVDRIISKYPFTRLKLSPSDSLLQDCGDRLAAKDNISIMLSNIVNIPNFKGNEPTSFPLRSAVNSFDQEWNFLPMFKETQEIDFTFLKKDFSSNSLSFNPLQFDKTDNELSYLLMSSLYLPETTNKDINHGHFKDLTYFQPIIRTSSKYWFFKPLSIGKTDLFTDWFENLPNSFKWLLNFISKYAFCNNIVLYQEIVRIERLLFLQKKIVMSKHLSTLTNKINVDF